MGVQVSRGQIKATDCEDRTSDQGWLDGQQVLKECLLKANGRSSVRECCQHNQSTVRRIGGGTENDHRKEQLDFYTSSVTVC